MTVSIMIQQNKRDIFIDAKENTRVQELKTMISSIIHVYLRDQELYYNGETMDDTKILSDYGLSSCLHVPHCPAFISLALRKDDGEFEKLNIPVEI